MHVTSMCSSSMASEWLSSDDKPYTCFWLFTGARTDHSGLLTAIVVLGVVICVAVVITVFIMCYCM